MAQEKEGWKGKDGNRKELRLPKLFAPNKV